MAHSKRPLWLPYAFCDVPVVDSLFNDIKKKATRTCVHFCPRVVVSDDVPAIRRQSRRHRWLHDRAGLLTPDRGRGGLEGAGFPVSRCLAQNHGGRVQKGLVAREAASVPRLDKGKRFAPRRGALSLALTPPGERFDSIRV